jgi:hypothetical protein
MIKVTARLEEISGLLSFWIGLLYLFMMAETVFYVHGVADTVFVILVGMWSAALLATSRRGGPGVVMFRIVSVASLVIGAIATAIWLPTFRALHS